MKAKDVRTYAAEQGLSEQEALKMVMAVNSPMLRRLHFLTRLYGR